MTALNTQDQGIIALSQEDYIPLMVESFLIDRKAQGLSLGSVHFYQKKLR